MKASTAESWNEIAPIVIAIVFLAVFILTALKVGPAESTATPGADRQCCQKQGTQGSSARGTGSR